MENFEEQLIKASRLAEISQQVGFTLWQIQELENVTAQFYVLLGQAEKGMGLAVGNALLDEALQNTFGKNVGNIKKAGLIDGEFETRISSLLKERNWLVHKSRLDSRNAVYHESAMIKLLKRLEAITEETSYIIKELGRRCETFVMKHGVSQDYINEVSQEILKGWRSE
jgi:hypothetical protein